MSSLRVLIVEDDKSFALEVEMLIDELGYELLKIVDNSSEALQYIQKQQPDLILMDVDIKGGMNGIEVANSIAHLKLPIIFMTASLDIGNYKKAQKLLPIAYLIKPFDALSLQSTIEIAVKKIVQQEELTEQEYDWSGDEILGDSIFVKKNNRLEKIFLDSIDWIQADGNYCYITIDKKRYAVKISMRKIMKFLAGNLFAQVHKSYAVSLKKIETIDFNENEVIINGKSLPLGRSYKDKLLAKLKILK